mgnify:FL=1
MSMKFETELQSNALKANFTEVQQAYFDRLMSELEVISDGLGFAELKTKAEAGDKEALQVMRDYVAKKEQIVEFIETKNLFDFKINWNKFEELNDYEKKGSRAKVFKAPGSEMLVLDFELGDSKDYISVVRSDDFQIEKVKSIDTDISRLIPVEPGNCLCVSERGKLYRLEWKKNGSHWSRFGVLAIDPNHPINKEKFVDGVSLNKDNCAVISKGNEKGILYFIDFSGDESILIEGDSYFEPSNITRLNDTQVVLTDSYGHENIICVDKSKPKERKWETKISDDDINESDLDKLCRQVVDLAPVDEKYIAAAVNWYVDEDEDIPDALEYCGIVLIDSKTGEEVDRNLYDRLDMDKFVEVVTSPNGQIMVLTEGGEIEVFSIANNKIIDTGASFKVGEEASGFSVMNDGKIMVTYKRGNMKIFGEKQL